MLGFKKYITCSLLLVIWTQFVTASNVNEKFRIQALEPQYDPADTCNVRALTSIAGNQDDVICDDDIRYNLVPSMTQCGVNNDDIYHQEYLCDHGVWKLMYKSGKYGSPGLQNRRKRWGWIVTAVVAVATAVYCDYKDEKYEDWTCSPKKVDPANLVAPTYTNCPTGGEVYTAPSKKRSAQVTWTKPQATDDEDTPTNEQTCCEYKNGDEFPGLPDGRKHTITYTAKDGYGLTATCSFSFTVKYITCDLQAPPTNGRQVSCTHNNIYGSECTYECNVGYEMAGSHVTTCQQDATWSNSPTCQKVVCPAPFTISNGNVECDDPTYPYDDDCLFTCNDGFELNSPSLKMTCQADQTWSVAASQVSCTDSEPPRIICPLPTVFYADRGSFGTAVTWLKPMATDNVDTNPAIVQISGPTQGEFLLEGSYSAVYRATDSQGNSVPALSECTLTLEVKVIKCSTGPTDALDESRFMMYNCSDTSFYNGVSCQLDCDLNLPLNGTNLVTCERNGTSDKGIWSWGSGNQPFCQVVECPAIDPPSNGAYIKDSVNARPLYILSCQRGYDIPLVGASFSGRLSCQDSGTWYPLDAFPDCVVSLLPLISLPAELYYDGDCNDAATQEQIKQQILVYLSGLQADIDQSICPNTTTCKTENLIVVCGTTSGKKRRAADEHSIHRRQTGYALVSFNIQIEFAPGNRTVNDAYVELLGVLLQISDKIQEDVDIGELDIAGFALSSDGYLSDTTQVAIVCDPGSKLDPSVLKCKPCPPGTYLNSTTGNCEQCNVGEYMDHEGAGECDPCPEGYSTLSTGSKSQQKCIELCSPGFYSSSTMVPCSACPVGQNQPLRGQSGCLSCPVGTATNATNSTSADQCKPFDLTLTQTTLVGDFNANGANVLSFSVWFKLGQDHSSEGSLMISDTQGGIIILSSSANISVGVDSSSLVPTSSALSSDHWTHVMGTVDFGSGTLQVYVDEALVVDMTGLSTDSSRSVSAGQVEITSTNSGGIFISGLAIYNRHLSTADMTSLSQTCAVTGNGEILSMTSFLANIADGIAIIAPTTCDPVDECASEPCGDHTCINMVNDFQCHCHGGMTGDLCDMPPDYCYAHGCHHGDCIPGNGKYTCSCSNGYTGVFCDIPPVNGGWADWSEWSGCDVTCNGGSRARTRNCTNPTPGPMGQDCAGNKIETESCNSQACSSCQDLSRKPGTAVSCVDNQQANVRECTMTCIKGQVLANGQKPFEKYTCGESTDHVWLPLNKTPQCLVPEPPNLIGSILTIVFQSKISSSDKESVQASVEQNLSPISCVGSDKCKMATSIDAAARKRRSTLSTMTLQFSIQLTSTGDLALGDYLTNGTETAAMTELLSAISSINEVIEYIQNNTEAVFNVNVGGAVYTVDTGSLDVAATITCEAGYAGADGLCALCPPGTKLNNPICENCEVGTYQPLYGQSSCLSCPAGYTTLTYGASDVSECSVELATTTAGTTTTTQTTTGSKDNNYTMIIVAAMSASAFVFSVIAIGVLLWKKCKRRGFRRNSTAGSLASLSMVRPETNISTNPVNYKVAFNPRNVSSPAPPYGASIADKPPSYSSHGFFHYPPDVNTNNKINSKTEVLDIVDY